MPKRRECLWEQNQSSLRVKRLFIQKGLMTKCIFISADHGMAIIYFLQRDVLPTLLNAGVEIVVITDDEIKDRTAFCTKQTSTFNPRNIVRI